MSLSWDDLLCMHVQFPVRTCFTFKLHTITHIDKREVAGTASGGCCLPPSSSTEPFRVKSPAQLHSNVHCWGKGEHFVFSFSTHIIILQLKMCNYFWKNTGTQWHTRVGWSSAGRQQLQELQSLGFGSNTRSYSVCETTKILVYSNIKHFVAGKQPTALTLWLSQSQTCTATKTWWRAESTITIIMSVLCDTRLLCQTESGQLPTETSHALLLADYCVSRWTATGGYKYSFNWFIGGKGLGGSRKQLYHE